MGLTIARVSMAGLAVDVTLVDRSGGGPIASSTIRSPSRRRFKRTKCATRSRIFSAQSTPCLPMKVRLEKCLPFSFPAPEGEMDISIHTDTTLSPINEKRLWAYAQLKNRRGQAVAITHAYGDLNTLVFDLLHGFESITYPKNSREEAVVTAFTKADGVIVI